MDTISVTGIVLASAQAGEADKRLVLLTREQGRISVFARGACRPKNALTAVSRVFATGTFTLIPKRDSYTLYSASIIDYFDPVVTDVEASAYGCYFLEMAGYFALENQDGTEYVNLVYVTLKALEKKLLFARMIRVIFEYRIFGISGVYPQVFTCQKCGKPLKEGYFSIASQNAVCTECGSGTGEYLSESAVYTIQHMLTAPIQRLYRFSVKAELLTELEGLITQWKRRFLDRNFKSETVLREILSYL